MNAENTHSQDYFDAKAKRYASDAVPFRKIGEVLQFEEFCTVPPEEVIRRMPTELGAAVDYFSSEFADLVGAPVKRLGWKGTNAELAAAVHNQLSINRAAYQALAAPVKLLRDLQRPTAKTRPREVPAVPKRPGVVFSPSDDLVQFWRRGIEAHIQEFSPLSFIQKTTKLLRGETPEAYKTAFTEKLLGIMSVLGHQQRHGVADYREFATSGRFVLRVQHAILNRIPICFDEATLFFARLFKELKTYLEQGGRISGDWGELLLDGDALELHTTAFVAPPADPSWTLAKRIE